jgi:cytochrome c556
MSRRYATIRAAVAVAALAAVPSLAVLAQAPPTARVVAERKESMKARGAAMRTLVLMARGEQPWDPQAAQRAATAVHSEAAKTIALFPEGTGPDRADTNALPTVWQDRPGFEAEAKKLEEATGRLLQMAQAGDESGVKAQIQSVGRVCSSCHERYRKPQQ